MAYKQRAYRGSKDGSGRARRGYRRLTEVSQRAHWVLRVSYIGLIYCTSVHRAHRGFTEGTEGSFKQYSKKTNKRLPEVSQRGHWRRTGVTESLERNGSRKISNVQISRHSILYKISNNTITKRLHNMNKLVYEIFAKPSIFSQEFSFPPGSCTFLCQLSGVSPQFRQKSRKTVNQRKYYKCFNYVHCNENPTYVFLFWE